jgi:hypothetical protein
LLLTESVVFFPKNIFWFVFLMSQKGYQIVYWKDRGTELKIFKTIERIQTNWKGQFGQMHFVPVSYQRVLWDRS